MLPEFTSGGELPIGVHTATAEEFGRRFGASSPRRIWLLKRFDELIDCAASSGELRRIFVWGSFVTSKIAPRDIDVLLIMAESFEVEHVREPAKEVFDATRAKLRFESDIFWARASIGDEVLAV